MWIVQVVTIWLLVISIMDIRRRRVPVWMLALGGALTLFTLVYRYESGKMDCFELLNGMLPGIVIMLIAFFTQKAGCGDGVVLLCIGMAAGGGKSFLLFGASLFLISIFSIILLAMRKVGKNTRIPYLPFLAAAWLLTFYSHRQ